MAAVKPPPPNTAALSVRSLSQAVEVLLLRAVLACLTSCPLKEELMRGAQSKTCWRLTTLPLTC